MFYTEFGWDVKTGIPTRATLESFGLGKVADELELKVGKAYWPMPTYADLLFYV